MSCCCSDDANTQVEHIDNKAALPTDFYSPLQNPEYVRGGNFAQTHSARADDDQASEWWHEEHWTDEDQAWRNEQAAWAEQSKEKVWIGDGFYFKVYLQKYDWEDKLGMTLNHDKEGVEVIVKSPSGRSLLEWNHWYPDAQIIAGDQIVSVNGITGDAITLIQAIKDHQYLMMDLYRLVKHRVTLKKPKVGVLGMALSPEAEILGIKQPSAAHEHNEKSLASAQILAGSRIVDVNGIQDQAMVNEVLRQVKNGESVEITLVRPMHQAAQGQEVPTQCWSMVNN